jgi:ubiquinol-cytochrome c reductase cytochrome b subunit
LGGVLALFAAIIILFIPPLTRTINKRRLSFYPLNQFIFWLLVASWAILTWIGGRPVEDPFIIIGQAFTSLYFAYFIINPLISKSWDSSIVNILK